MMDLLWREGKGGRNTRAEGAESPGAQRLSWAPLPDPYRVPGKKKLYKTGANSLFEQVPADFCIHCAERIVQEVDVCILIHSSRKQRDVKKGHFTLPGSRLWIIMVSNNVMFLPGAQGKGPDPASHRSSQWAGSVCSRPLGAVEEEGQDGNWNPIYLARLTRAFCPSLSGVPPSPVTVRSLSFKFCKSCMEIEKEKKGKHLKCVLLPS